MRDVSLLRLRDAEGVGDGEEEESHAAVGLHLLNGRKVLVRIVQHILELVFHCQHQTGTLASQGASQRPTSGMNVSKVDHLVGHGVPSLNCNSKYLMSLFTTSSYDIPVVLDIAAPIW